MDDEVYGANVRKRRRALGLPQMALALAIRRPQTTISRIENGYLHATPSTRERIERFLREREARLTVPASEPHIRRVRP